MWLFGFPIILLVAGITLDFSSVVRPVPSFKEVTETVETSNDDF